MKQKHARLTRKSGFASLPNAKQIRQIAALSLGHSSLERYRERCPPPNEPHSLGEPLSICEAAALIGCSVWTVRQTLIPLGMPVFRSGAGGKLIFYREQLVRWIESHQGETL